MAEEIHPSIEDILKNNADFQDSIQRTIYFACRCYNYSVQSLAKRFAYNPASIRRIVSKYDQENIIESIEPEPEIATPALNKVATKKPRKSARKLPVTAEVSPAAESLTGAPTDTNETQDDVKTFLTVAQKSLPLLKKGEARYIDAPHSPYINIPSPDLWTEKGVTDYARQLIDGGDNAAAVSLLLCGKLSITRIDIKNLSLADWDGKRLHSQTRDSLAKPSRVLKELIDIAANQAESVFQADNLRAITPEERAFMPLLPGEGKSQRNGATFRTPRDISATMKRVSELTGAADPFAHARKSAIFRAVTSELTADALLQASGLASKSDLFQILGTHPQLAMLRPTAHQIMTG